MTETQKCPLMTLEVFKESLQGSQLTETQMKDLFDNLKKEERERKMNGGGGKKRRQFGGVKCDVLHSVYRWSFLIAGVLGVSYFTTSQYVTCLYNPDVVELAKYFKFLFTDVFNPRHFGHAWDLFGKMSALGLGTLDKFTGLLKECLPAVYAYKTKDISDKCTMTWVKNIFEIFCQLDSGEVKLEDAKNQLTGIVATEAIKNEDKYENIPQANAEGVVAYDGKKEVRIVVGDAIITIKPNNLPVATADAVPLVDDEDYAAYEDSIQGPGEGGRRRKKKTNRFRKTHRHKKTRRRS